MKTLLGILGIVLFALAGITVAPTAAMATPSICDVTAGNIVLNCGFEGGTYSSMIGGNTNNNVPNDWTPNAGYDLEPVFNFVTASPGRVNSGNDALSIGNFSSEPAPQLTQTLTDVFGDMYSGSLYVLDGASVPPRIMDSRDFFNVTINGLVVVSLNDNAPGVYTRYTFNFVGSGSDVLGLTGNNNVSEWYVDDVVVTTGGSTPVPEPATLALLGLGLAGLGFSHRKLR